MKTKKKKLGDYEFECGGCKKVHKMCSYAIAQRAMGHGLTHTCECGHKNSL